MADPRFFSVAGPFDIEEIAEIALAEVHGELGGNRTYEDVRSLQEAGPAHVSFLDNNLYKDAFKASRAGACIVRPRLAELAPSAMTLLLTDEPYRSYARVAQHFYPDFDKLGWEGSGQSIDPTAEVGDKCRIASGAVIGPRAEIGDGCEIGANTIVGPGCVLGQGCIVGPGVSLAYCLIGSRVVIHAGVRIGQDGFGFAPGADGHLKVPQLGRVVIEDDVEIGANTTIDRGTAPDTIIGQGTKIDNLVQIGHNVRIGKGCILVSLVGISGSTEIGDFVMIGGQAGIAGHLKIGDGVQIAAQTGVTRDIEAGATVGGWRAKPMRVWLREIATLERLAKKSRTQHDE